MQFNTKFSQLGFQLFCFMPRRARIFLAANDDSNFSALGEDATGLANLDDPTGNLVFFRDFYI